jgi:hypothetical protein
MSQNTRRKIRSWYKKADWKISADYPDAAASPSRLAWEFLRRNENFSKEHKALMVALGKLARSERDDIDNPFHMKLSEHCTKWGIDRFYPNAWIFEYPDDYDVPCRFISGGPDVITYGVQFKEDGPWCNVAERFPDSALIRFDLSSPIVPQIKAAEYFLLANASGDQSKSVLQKKKFTLYLRAFDGYKEAGSYKTVADQFSTENLLGPNADYEQNVENWKYRADDYIKEDYLKIPRQFNTEYWEGRERERNKTKINK